MSLLRARVDLDAIANNVHTVKTLLGEGTRLMCVVKALSLIHI